MTKIKEMLDNKRLDLSAELDNLNKPFAGYLNLNNEDDRDIAEEIARDEKSYDYANDDKMGDY